MEPTAIFIGPMAAGKTTVSGLVAARLAVPHVALDELCRGYYEEDGYNRSRAEELLASHGESAFMEYVAPYYAYAVERVLEDHAGCVLDFGAGHVVHDRPELFERVRSALAPFPHVILILPSASVNESMSILRDRILGRVAEYAEEGEDYRWAIAENERIMCHPSNRRLAKVTVYTNDKSPEETCEEIIQLISQSDR